MGCGERKPRPGFGVVGVRRSQTPAGVRGCRGSAEEDPDPAGVGVLPSPPVYLDCLN